MLALMKKKAEAEARESLPSADIADHADSCALSSSVPDDAKELIAAMRSEADAKLLSPALNNAEKNQKSRARRLTSTTVALDEAAAVQAGCLRESSGDAVAEGMGGGGSR
jgi:hypothetical protein